MSNSVRIELKREHQAVVFEGKIKETCGPIGFQVYVCTDAISVWIGTCTDVESLEEIISEEELIKSIYESASECEIENIMPILKFNNYKYDFFGETRTAIIEK